MSPYYADASATVYAGDCLDVLRELPTASVDAVVTDPPYGLGFMGKEWDDLPPGREWAAECLRVLKPGGHLLAFGGTRTWHRLACAIEDAGFEVRDSIAWMYGSGFPKSLDVSKAIDKAAGAEREIVGIDPRYVGMSDAAKRAFGALGHEASPTGFSGDPSVITAPATPDARQWQGWGTALKPAHEPVVCAQKPFSAVPLDWRMVASVHHALAGLLWLSLSPVKRAELTSQSSPAGLAGGTCVSALVAAATHTSPDASGETATYSSPATASTSSSIASSWSSILAALSAQTSMSTTSTRSSTTTALSTLSSLLAPLTSPSTMPACGCPLSGSPSTAPNVGSSSTDEWATWLRTLSASVPETAIEGTALAVASVLASVAASLSSDQAAASSARSPATTPTATSTDSGTSARTGGSSPAHEPIVVARKPLTGTVAANVLAHGTGALNIDATRVEGEVKGWETPRGGIWTTDSDATAALVTRSSRWPANVVLDESQAAALDEQSGESVTGSGPLRRNTALGVMNDDGWRPSSQEGARYPGEGGASRFFYTAKADAGERVRIDGIAHPTVKPLSLMRWLVRLVCPPGGTCLDPFAGSGTTVEAAILEGFRCIAVEREADYLPLITQRIHRRRDPVAAVRATDEDPGLFDLLDDDGGAA